MCNKGSHEQIVIASEARQSRNTCLIEALDSRASLAMTRMSVPAGLSERAAQAERGLTLIELLIFIVIVGIAATAILGVFGSLTRNSASLLPDKQAQAIAASMLEEVLAQPFTFCDPNDANASTAASVAGCASPLLRENNLAPEAGELRGGASPFDNVNDYNGFGPVAVSFPDNSGVAGLPG